MKIRRDRPSSMTKSIIWLLMALLSFPTYGQIIPVPGFVSPALTQAANGVPGINIVAPNAAGVSHNRYYHFNVTQRGLILNNSAVPVQTKIGGMMPLNPYLVYGPARLILNEVVGTERSQLLGALEVAGHPANLVVANPNGIYCNGCGFVNTHRVTLTTGVPQIHPLGHLAGFSITQGEIEIGPQGLNAQEIQQLDLLARSLSVGGTIDAKTIGIVTGANDINYDAPQSPIVKNMGTEGGKPKFAVDVKAMGGMHAGQIYVIATEAGLGVNSQGRIIADSGSMVLSANGDLKLKDAYAKTNAAISSQGKLEITGHLKTGGKLHTSSNKLINTGHIESQEDALLTAQRIKNNGTITSHNVQGLTLKAQKISNRGTLYSGGKVNLEADQLKDVSGEIRGKGGVLIKTKDFTSNNTKLRTESDLQIMASTVNKTGGSWSADKKANIESQSFNQSKGSIESGEGIQIKSEEIENEEGDILSSGNLLLEGKRIKNTGTVSSLETLNIKADQLDNQGKLLSKNGHIESQNFSNEKGNVVAQENLALKVENSLNNQGGLIQSEGGIQVNAKELDNQKGKIVGQRINLEGGKLNNTQGDISALEKAAPLPTPTLSLNLKEINNTAGLIQSQNNADIKSQSRFLNGQGGLLGALEDLALNADQIINAGKLQSGKTLTLQTKNDLINAEKGQLSGKNVQLISAKDILNQGVIDGATVNIKAQGNFVNHKGAVYADDGSIYAASIQNIGGSLVGRSAQGHLKLAGNSLLNTGKSWIFGQGRISIGRSINAQGEIEGLMDVLENRSSRIESHQDVKIHAKKVYNKRDQFEAIKEQVGTPFRQEVFLETKNGFDALGWVRVDKYKETLRTQYRTRIVKDSGAAQILAGLDLYFDEGIELLENDKSEIAAGRKLTLKKMDVYQPISFEALTWDEVNTQFVRYAQRSGCSNRFNPMCSNITKEPQGITVEIIDKKTIPAILSSQTSLEGSIGNIEDIKHTPIDPSIAVVIDYTRPDGQAPLRPQTIYLPLEIPNNPIFNINLDPSASILIETDPRFLNGREYLSSDYYFKKLAEADASKKESREAQAQKTTNLLKRYGDGFVEQQRINDQIISLTGKRYLDGYTNTEDEYKALMEAGIAYAKEYSIRPGVSLSAEQMEKLTTDIVLMVEQEVTLPNGKKERVLVPQVYLRKPKEGDLRPDGSLIVSNKVDLKVAGNINNKGTIRGTESLNLEAGNILNQGGRIEGQNVDISSKKDIINVGGTIQGIGENNQVYLNAANDIIQVNSQVKGEDVLLEAGNNIALNQSSVQGTHVDLDAGKDIHLKASRVSAKEDLMAAAGGNILAESIETQKGFSHGIGGLNIQGSSIQNTLSQLEAGGHVVLSSGEQTTLKGTHITAGKEVFIEGKDVSIESVKDRYSASLQFGSLQQTHTLEVSKGGSIVGGQGVSIIARGQLTGQNDATGHPVAQAGTGNINLKGTQIQSGGDVNLLANHHINIKSDPITSTQSLTAGPFSGAAFIQQMSTPATITAGSDVQMEAGGNLSLTNTKVSAANDILALAKGSVELNTDVNKFAGFGMLGGDTAAKAGAVAYIHSGSDLSAGGNVLISGGDQVNLKGANLTAGKDTIIEGKDINIQGVKDLYANALNTQGSLLEKMSGGNIVGGEGVTLQAKGQITGTDASGKPIVQAGTGNVNLKGVHIQSGGEVNVVANNHVVIKGDQVLGAYTGTTGGTTGWGAGLYSTPSAIASGGSIQLGAANDIHLNNVKIAAGQDVIALAQGSILLDSDASKIAASLGMGNLAHDAFGSFHSGTDIASGKNLLLLAGENVHLKGANLLAGQELAILGKNIQIEAVKDITVGRLIASWDKGHANGISGQETLSGGTLQSGSHLTVGDGSTHNILVKGAVLTSQTGTVSLIANNDIKIEDIKLGFFSAQTQHQEEKKKTSTIYRDTQLGELGYVSQGSLISGNQVLIKAGDKSKGIGDITIKGSHVVSDTGTYILAGRNISVLDADSLSMSFSQNERKQNGLFGSGTHITAGNRHQGQDGFMMGIGSTGSVIGSIGGNVILNAGKDYLQTGSQILAPGGDVQIKAQRINILDSHESWSGFNKETFKQRGVTTSINNPVVSSVQTMQQMGRLSGQTTDKRMQGLALATGIVSGLNAYEALVAAQSPYLLGGISSNLGFGQNKSQQQGLQMGYTSIPSLVTAGGNIDIRAEGLGTNSYLNIAGSNITSGLSTTLKSDGVINIVAGQSLNVALSENSSGSRYLGVGAEMGGSRNGVVLNVGAGGGKGYGNGIGLNYSNSQISSGGTVKLESGTDTTIIGGIVSGNQVVANVGTSGRGNLTIASVQDVNTYQGNQKNWGASGSLCIPPFCTGPSNVALNRDKSPINSFYQSITAQSGIYAGNGGFQVEVKGNTGLIGSVISSNNFAVDSGLNRLITGSLTYADLQNTANYDAQRTGYGFGYGNGVSKDQRGNPRAGTLGIPGFELPSYNGFSATPPITLKAGDSQSTTTYSGVSGGTIIITNPNQQLALTGQTPAQIIANLNRDTSNTANPLQPIFNEQEIRTRFDIVEGLTKEVGTYVDFQAKKLTKLNEELNTLLAKGESPNSDRVKDLMSKIKYAESWGPGGTLRQLTTALTSAAGGNVMGSNGKFLQAATVNYFQSLGAEQVKVLAPHLGGEGSPAHIALHAILACGGAAAQSESCGAGALGASSAVVLSKLMGDTANLTPEEREARRNLVTSLIAGIAGSTNSKDIAAILTAAKIETENNTLKDFLFNSALKIVKASAEKGKDLVIKHKDKIGKAKDWVSGKLGKNLSLDDLKGLEGAKISQVKRLIPKDWTSKPLKKGEGTRYFNPNKPGETIMIEKGWSGAKDPLHSGPYLKISRDGKVTRIPLEGNPVLKGKT